MNFTSSSETESLMAVLVWKHETTRQDARKRIEDRLKSAHVSEKVSWNGDIFSSSVGWGTILNLVGEVTDDAVVLRKSSGAMGGVILAKSREGFQQLFPEGREVSTDPAA